MTNQTIHSVSHVSNVKVQRPEEALTHYIKKLNLKPWVWYCTSSRFSSRSRNEKKPVPFMLRRRD